MDILFVDLLLEFSNDLDLILTYLTDLLGSSSAAEQAIVSEDIVL